jgi:SpoVK/Ycf46/Vps4 family AAA+-type ATPase
VDLWTCGFQSKTGGFMSKNWEYTNVDKNFSHWSKRGGRFYPINATHEGLPSGVYEVKTDSEDVQYAVQIGFPADALIDIPGTPIDYIVNQMKDFWSKRELFNDIGLLYKRGVLLYGPSGCGKTSIIRMLCDQIIVQNGVIVSVTSIRETQNLLLRLREIEPTRPLMTIFEDIEGIMEEKSTASDVLSFLDGEKQLDNIIHVATTNKPDILEDRLLRRPGRFDLVVGLNPPITEAREKYIRHVANGYLSQEQIGKMIQDTAGLGLAHIRELIVSLVCFNLNYDETLKRLKGNAKNEFKAPKVGQEVEGYTLGFTK